MKTCPPLNIFNCSPFTANLSSVVLSEHEILLLDKGLSFIPSVCKVPLKFILECKQRNIRNLQLRDFFKNKPNTDYDPTLFRNKFLKKSTWTPPLEGISEQVRSICYNLANYTNDLVIDRLKRSSSGIAHVVCNGARNGKKLNLSEAEFKAINTLKNNKNIVIKPADKGGAVVVMDRSLYEAEGLRQLNNLNYYAPIQSPDWENNIKDINLVLNRMYQQGFITDKQLDYLKAKQPAKPRPFYLLPKVHKDRSKWNHPHMPEGRPIVSDCGSETYQIGEIIDHYLKPLSNKHPAYLKDSYDFVKKIRNQSIPRNALICTADVTGLYPNMLISRSLQVVRDIFLSNPDPSRPDEEIIRLLELSLTRNDFVFAERFFRQVCGTAMGKKYAPSLADLYLIELDTKACNGFHLQPLFYYRYLDDIFFVWTGSRAELQQYMKFLNSIIPGINLTVNIREYSNEFLDLIIYKSFSGTNCSLQTRVYFKPTDTHQLLHSLSDHPGHTCKGILKSQLLRFKRLGCNLFQYNQAAHTLFSILSKRGYSKRLFRQLKNHIWYNYVAPIKNAGNDLTQLFPIINYYDPISVKIMAFTRDSFSVAPIVESKYRLIQAYKIHNNLAKMLTRSLFQ